MSAKIYLEGGGDGKDLKSDCRKGFRQLLESSGFTGRPPGLVACGGRNSTYDKFKTAHACGKAEYVAMLIDSEDPVADIEKTWDHLKKRDGWGKPQGAEDNQVLFMTTCMETWIAADRDALKKHYDSNLQESALPPLDNMEKRDRHDVQDSLIKATRSCKNAYGKGKRSFEILGKLNPDTLRAHLPSFQRMLRILGEYL